MSNTYKLTEPYPTGQFHTAHDVQRGKRRHFPEGQHVAWEKPQGSPMPYAMAVVIFFVCMMAAVVVL